MNIKSFILSLRLSRHIYYTAVFCGGYYLAEKICVLHFMDFRFFSGVILINLLFASSLMINNFYDWQIDSVNGKSNPLNSCNITTRGYMAAFFIFTAASVLLSLSISISVFYISIIIHLVSWIYSGRPLRLKRFFPFNTMLIAVSTALTIVLGFFDAGGIFARIPFGFIVVLTGLLFLSFNAKDINDYEGDKKYSVQTLMTLLGPFKGRFTIAVLACAAYMLVPLIIKSHRLIAPAMIFGGATFYFILRKNKINEVIIFMLFFCFAAIFVYLNPLKF